MVLNIVVIWLLLCLPLTLYQHLVKEILHIKVLELFQLECLAVVVADVSPCPVQTLQILGEVEQLLVSLVLVEWYDGDAVLELVAEGVDGVVDDHYVFEFPRGFEDSQVLDEDTPFGSFHATVSVESFGKYLTLGVYQI
jgi:hypothetical protein